MDIFLFFQNFNKGGRIELLKLVKSAVISIKKMTMRLPTSRKTIPTPGTNKQWLHHEPVLV